MLVEVRYKQLGGSIGDYLKVFAGKKRNIKEMRKYEHTYRFIQYYDK